MKKINIRKKIAHTLELPQEYLDDVSKISILGFKEVTIENYKSLIEYEQDVIRINTRDKLIKIEGGGLFINNITDEEITVMGDIQKVLFD